MHSFFKKVFHNLPFHFKYFLRDVYFFIASTKRGAINIKNIKIDRKFDKVAVLGNGPSLKKDKGEILALVGSYDFVCVNNFCDDDLYHILKPSLYIFLDGYFFSPNAHSSWVERRNKTFRIIDDKTAWKMTIVVPYSADESVLRSRIRNKNITIVKVTAQNLFSKRYNKFVKWGFDSGFYGPPQVNVLLYAIYLPLILGYHRIDIFGADLSFHNDVNVDQLTNELFMTFKHFNEEDKREVLKKNPEKIDPWRMAELLELSANTFYAHEIIYQYSQSKGIEIYNKSSYSLIDAYPRSS